ERSAEDLAQVLDRLWCLQDESGPSVLKASIQALLDRDLGAKLMPESESQLEVVIEHLDEANSTALNRVLPEGGVGALTEAQQAAIVSLGPWLSRVHNFSAESWDDLWRQVLGEKPVDLRSILSVGNFELHCYAFQTPMTEAPSLTHLAATVAGAGGVFAHQVARELEDCRDEFLSEMVRVVDAGRLINFLPEYVDVAFIEKLCKMALVETDPDLLSVHFASLLRSACPAATALVMQQLRQMSDAQLQRLASGKDAAGVVLALVDMGADGELTRKLATLALGSELTLAKRLHNAAKLCNLSEIVRGAIDFSTVDPNELSKAPLKQRLNLALHLERQQATYLVPSEMRAEWMKVSAEAEELERQGRTVEALFVLVSLRNLIGSHTEEGEYVENELTLPYVFTMLNCCDTSGALPRLASRLTQLPLQSLFQLAKKAEVHIGDQAEASKALLATLSADNKSLLAGVLNVRSEELLWTLSEGKKNREILRNLMRVA
ncbi:MAG: hypothetical protein KDK78_02885, partial [Chlamydiia bacterium]|nr:hypothetical protein [Chlamydiia bacterium]